MVNQRKSRVTLARLAGHSISRTMGSQEECLGRRGGGDVVRLLFLAVLGLVAVHRPSLVMVRGLLTVVASPVTEHGLQGTWASAVATHGFIIAA